MIRIYCFFTIYLTCFTAIANEASNSSSFGFSNYSSESLFSRSSKSQGFLKKSVGFEYDKSWNATFLNSKNAGGICSSSVGNALVVESHGSGNTLTVVNKQQNSESVISARCTFGN